MAKQTPRLTSLESWLPQTKTVAWSAIDLSPYIVFADGASGGTTNVNIFNETGVTFTYATGTETTAGATPTWTNGTVTPTILVESGGIEE